MVGEVPLKEPLTVEELEKFNVLYENMSKYVWSLAYRRTNSVYESDDILQSVFLTALIKIREVIKHPNQKGWLCMTTLNHTRHYWRSVRRIRTEELPMDDILDYADPTESVDSELEGVLGHLSAKERDMIIWYYGERLPLKDIAVRCGITYGTCRVYMSQLKKKIKNFLEAN